MLEPSIRPDSKYITFDSFCKEPSFEEGHVIVFDTDEDFINFCVDPVALAVRDKDGNIVTLTGQYSELYRKCCDAGMMFGIRKEDSVINKNKVACTRVAIPRQFRSPRKYTLVQLPVENIEYLVRKHYICNGEVYSYQAIIAYIVYRMVYTHEKTPDEVREILRSHGMVVLTYEQYEQLDQSARNQYRVFSIKRVKYPYEKHSLRDDDLIELAAEYGLHVENLILSRS